ncbi:IS110 family transposase [Tardiphaga sp.]|uniref:IS110 family transposase n=1 Tax=Tardiphaga sp. TaxID=1926292 RepID=UPI0026137BA9|nr:IS110 family transposase [Tardiphaga sp.]MDB5620623.1 Transposase [Tardiphaga sp.]
MKIHPGFVGIDISKDFLDVFNGSVGAVRRVDNRPEAIDRLIAGWAGNDVFVLFEATGHYDKALRQALSAAGIAFARVNPARARDFARAAGFLAKTDAINAGMLAGMAQCLRPGTDSAADPAREQLAELHKRRDQLVACRKQERTRLKGDGADLAASLTAHIAWLDEAVRDFDRRIATLITEQHALQNAQRLMHSVPGIGPVCSATLLALMPELGSRAPKAIAALAGLAPFNTDSGKFRGVRRIHGGRRRVREALYMAAVSATRTKSRLAQAYRALREAGKPAKVALIAVARKLLLTLNAIIREQQPFHA